MDNWTCIYCGALVAAEQRRQHSAWHQRYRLHAPGCPAESEPDSGTGEGVARCTCGLALWTGQ